MANWRPRRTAARSEVEQWRELVRQNPNDALVHAVFAQKLAYAKDTKGADAEIKEALRLDPHSCDAWIAASVVALQAKNFEAAIDACKRALSIDAENYSALNNLGVALRAAGRGREGNEILLHAARVDPEGTTARRNITRAGLLGVRGAVMVLLIPVIVLTGASFGIYVLIGAVSNVLISLNHERLLGLERWMAPVTKRLSTRSDGMTEIANRRVPFRRPQYAPSDVNAPWSAVDDHYTIGNGAVRLIMWCCWGLVVGLAVALAFLKAPPGAVIASILMTSVVAAVPSWILFRRKRRRERRATARLANEPGAR